MVASMVAMSFSPSGRKANASPVQMVSVFPARFTWARATTFARRGSEKVDLELYRQHFKALRRDGERRIAAGRVEDSCHRTRMHEAVLLAHGCRAREADFGGPAAHRRQLGSQRLHHPLAGKTFAYSPFVAFQALLRHAG